jgi:hypothetical protein
MANSPDRETARPLTTFRGVEPDIGPAARDGQVVQDRPPLPLELGEQAGGAALPRRPSLPAPTASGLGRNRSPQPAAMAASPPRTSPSLGASRLPRSPPTVATARMAATRQGTVRVQAAHSAARNRRHRA